LKPCIVRPLLGIRDPVPPVSLQRAAGGFALASPAVQRRSPLPELAQLGSSEVVTYNVWGNSEGLLPSFIFTEDGM